MDLIQWVCVGGLMAIMISDAVLYRLLLCRIRRLDEKLAEHLANDLGYERLNFK